MAMIDYGAIAFKNGKLISTDFFTSMLDTTGWEDCNGETYHNYATGKQEPLGLMGNYFVYIGDADCTVAFYKTGICIVERFKNEFWRDEEWFNSAYYTWSKWEKPVAGNDIKVTKRNGYYVFKWKYKGDAYKVYFGYGVDLDYYKKWHIVNYYRSPEYYMRKLKRKISYICRV